MLKGYGNKSVIDEFLPPPVPPASWNICLRTAFPYMRTTLSTTDLSPVLRFNVMFGVAGFRLGRRRSRGGKVSGQGMGTSLLLTEFWLHLSHPLFEAFVRGLFLHSCTRNSQQKT